MENVYYLKNPVRVDRLRVLSFLADKGIMPIERLVDLKSPYNGKIRYYWNFDLTDELICALNEYMNGKVIYKRWEQREQ